MQRNNCQKQQQNKITESSKITRIGYTHRNISVTRNTIINWNIYEYVPSGYNIRVISSVVRLRYAIKNSVANGSEGRISRKKPKMHNSNDTFSQFDIIVNAMNYFFFFGENLDDDVFNQFVY